MHDVAIVGAGLAGLQCARLLATRGLRVVLIDRKDTLAAPIHTTGIFSRRAAAAHARSTLVLRCSTSGQKSSRRIASSTARAKKTKRGQLSP